MSSVTYAQPATIGSSEVFVSVVSQGGERQVSAKSLNLDKVLEDVRLASQSIRDQLIAAGPAEVAVEFTVGFTMKPGGILAALLFQPEAQAGMKVSLKWSDSSAKDGAR